MAMDELSLNYANALFSLVSVKERKEYGEALSAIRMDLKSNPDFARLVCSRSIDRVEKEGVLTKVYGEKYRDLPHLLPFLKTINAHHRFPSFAAIVAAYRYLLNDSLGVKEGIAFSAEKLSDAELKKITEALEKKLGCEVYLTNSVDHTLLGGVKVAIDDKVFDGTLKNKLSELKRTLQGGTAQ